MHSFCSCRLILHTKHNKHDQRQPIVHTFEISGNKNIQRPDGLTPFHLAAQNGHLKICKYLISTIKEKNPTSTSGLTPLHFAALNGRFKVCRLIIKNLRHKNPGDINAWTPLHSAAKRGHLDVCRIILSEIGKVIFQF